jgi:hypothetical protein
MALILKASIYKKDLFLKQIEIYRFPACPFFIDLVNALKCLVLQDLRAFLI